MAKFYLHYKDGKRELIGEIQYGWFERWMKALASVKFTFRGY